MNRLMVIMTLLTIGVAATGRAAEPIRVLITDGQNNHGAWPKTTMMMKDYLEETGRFTVDIVRSRYTWKGEDLLEQYPLEGSETTVVEQPQSDPDFRPEFSRYDVVISNFGFGAAPWPKETQEDFEKFVREGGGFVSIHAADNSFPDWPAYNLMIGLGGWGGRTEKAGPYVYTTEQGDIVRDQSPGRGGSHGSQHEFAVVIRDTEHPITKGLPREWMHAKDELYDRLRGPAQNMEILATAWADPEQRGSGRHEPMLMTITYGKGRVFHNPMGHADYSMECVGFITLLQRGTEWAATGEVTLPVPEDFPGAEAVSVRPYSK